jgi:hypothetical protein
MFRPIIGIPDCPNLIRDVASWRGQKLSFNLKSESSVICTDALGNNRDKGNVDLLFNFDNHPYVIPDVNSTNILDKIFEAFNCNCSNTEDNTCLENEAFLKTISSYMAFLYSDATINYTQGIQLYNQFQNLVQTECQGTPGCFVCSESATLTTTSSGEVDVIVDIEDGSFKILYSGSGSAADECPSGSACGGAQGQSCTPSVCSPCSIDDIGDWVGKGNCADNLEFTVKSWTNTFWDSRQDDIDCECLSSPLKNIKVTINNQEIHLPILCDGKCDDFETVD